MSPSYDSYEWLQVPSSSCEATGTALEELAAVLEAIPRYASENRTLPLGVSDFLTIAQWVRRGSLVPNADRRDILLARKVRADVRSLLV